MVDNAIRIRLRTRADGGLVQIGKGTFGLVIEGSYAFGPYAEVCNPCAIKLAQAKESAIDFVAEYDAIHALNEKYRSKRGGSERSLRHAYFPEVYSISYLKDVGLDGFTGETCGFVMQLLGCSVDAAFRETKHFDRGDLRQYALFVLAVRVFEILSFLTNEGGVVHRDIKPDNWLLPHQNKISIEGLSMVRMIDFGFSANEAKVNRDLERYRLEKYANRKKDPRFDAKKTKVDDMSVICKFVGSVRYCSVLVHMGHPPSYATDFESALYTLLYCYYGSLPWQQSRQKDCDRVMIKDSYALATSDPKLKEAIDRTLPLDTAVGYYKTTCKSNDLASGLWLEGTDRKGIAPLPEEFATLLEMARTKRLAASEHWKKTGKAAFSIKPDYETAKNLAQRVATRLRDKLLLEKQRLQQASLV